MPLLLHISDLHLSEISDTDLGDYKSNLVSKPERQRRKTQIAATLKGIEGYLKDKKRKLDAVIVSGDITYCCEEDGFLCFESVLNELGNCFPGPSHTIVVPGNHDVRWGTLPSTKERYELFMRYLRERDFITPCLEGVDLDQDGRKLTKHNPSLLLKDSGMVLIAMNSSNWCGTLENITNDVESTIEKITERSVRNHVKEIVDKCRVFDLARISPAQFRCIASALDEAVNRLEDLTVYPIKVLVLHHHLHPISPYEELKPFSNISNLGAFEQFLSQKNIDIVLHGHKHIPYVYRNAYKRFDVSASLSKVETGALIVSAGYPGSTTSVNELCKLIEFNREPSTTRGKVTFFSIPPLAYGGTFHTPLKVSSTVTLDHVLYGTHATLVEGYSLEEVYGKLISTLENYGGILKNVVCTITDGSSALRLPRNYPLQFREDSERQQWFEDMIWWWQNPNPPQLIEPPFTHGQRLRNFGGHIDQIDRIVEALWANLETGTAVACVFDPGQDQLKDTVSAITAWITVQFSRSIDGRAIDCLSVFRHQSARLWWPLNCGEAATLQEYIVAQLNSRGASVSAGSITTITGVLTLGSATAKMGVSLVDGFAARSPEKLFALVHWLFHPNSTDELSIRDQWERILDEIAPDEISSTGGRGRLPIPTIGLEKLSQLLIWFSSREENSSGNRLGNILEEVLKENLDYLRNRAAKGNSPELFNKWWANVSRLRDEAKRIIKRIIENK